MKKCFWKPLAFGTQITTFTNSNDFLQIKLIPVHSGVIPVSFRCHSGSFRCHSGSFRCHSGSFRSIPVSFRCHSGSFRFIPVHSGPFHLIPVHSAPFRCLVTPIWRIIVVNTFSSVGQCLALYSTGYSAMTFLINRTITKRRRWNFSSVWNFFPKVFLGHTKQTSRKIYPRICHLCYREKNYSRVYQ